MTEAQFQRGLKKRIRARFPGCKVFENDPQQEQGIPDILILYKGFWAMLEVKLDGDVAVQPNQVHRVAAYNEMSFAAFITPSTEEEVLNAVQSAFGLVGEACVS